MAKKNTLCLNVRINKDAMTSHTVTVPGWEAAILAAVWGDDAVIDPDPVMLVRQVPPSPADEFQRLALKYGPKHEETPYVAAVYGNFGPGINALRDAIVDACEITPEEPAADEPVAEGSPVAAGGVSVESLGLDEGGDSELNLADLTGDVTEPAEAVA